MLSINGVRYIISFNVGRGFKRYCTIASRIKLTTNRMLLLAAPKEHWNYQNGRYLSQVEWSHWSKQNHVIRPSEDDDEKLKVAIVDNTGRLITVVAGQMNL